MSGVADALGIDDGSDLLEWRYGQRRATSKAELGTVAGYGVEVRIDPASDVGKVGIRGTQHH